MSFIATPVCRWFKVDLASNGGGMIAADDYKAVFYEPGTLVAKTVYTDAAATVAYPSPSNEAPFNSEGYALVSLKDGEVYRMQIVDGDGVVKEDIEGVTAGSGGGITTADSYADLQDADINFGFAYIPGYYGDGDGGHGMFFLGGVATPDSGYIQSSNQDATKRWYRIPDEDGFVRAASFGVDQGTGAIRTTEMTNANAYAAAQNRPLLVDGATVAGQGNNPIQIGTMTFTAPRVVFVGASIKGVVVTPTVTFDSLVEAPPDFFFDGMTVVFTHKDQVALPEWFKAVGDGATDDLAELDAMFASGAKKFVLADKDYEVTGAPTFPSEGIIESYGTITQGGTTHVSPGIWVITSGGLVKAEKIEATTTVTAGTNVDAGANVNATQDLTAGQDLVAGVLGDGYMEGRIGGKKFRAGGRVLQDLTITTVTGDDTEKNLLSAVLPANTLINNGDSLYIYTWIVELNDGSNDSIDFTYRVYIDSQVIYEAKHINNPSASPGAGIDLEGPFRLKLTKVTDDTPPNSGLESKGDLLITGPIQVGTKGVGQANLGADGRSAILDLTSAQTIQFTVQIEDGDGVQQASQERLYIDYQPAATP